MIYDSKPIFFYDDVKIYVPGILCPWKLKNTSRYTKILSLTAYEFFCKVTQSSVGLLPSYKITVFFG